MNNGLFCFSNSNICPKQFLLKHVFWLIFFTGMGAASFVLTLLMAAFDDGRLYEGQRDRDRKATAGVQTDAEEREQPLLLNEGAQ